MEDEMKRELNSLKQAVADLAKVTHAGFSENRAALRGVAIKVAKLEAGMAEVKETMAPKDAMTSMFKRLTDKIDGFLTVIEVARNDRTVSDQSFDLLRNRIDDHDRRLSRLEKKPA
jgi:hypothetical protein